MHYREVVSPLVHWIRYDIDSLVFSQSAALMVLQGWPMLKFFEGVRFSSPLTATSILDGVYTGTFVLLRGELSDVTLPPLKLSKIVLAKIVRLEDGQMLKDDILSILLQEVL